MPQDDLLDQIVKKHQKSQTPQQSGSAVISQVTADQVGEILDGGVKKKASTAGLSSGAPLSPNGGETVQPFQNVSGALYPENHSDTRPTEYTPIIDDHTLNDNIIHNRIDPHEQAIDKAASTKNFAAPNPVAVSAPQKEKEGRGIMDAVSQALYLPAFNKGFNDLVVKPMAGGTDFIDRTIDKAYTGITGQETPSWLRKKGAFDKVAKYYDEEYQARDKPKNMVSDVAEGVVGTLPLMASLYTGEGEASLAQQAPKMFTKVTKLFATTKAASAYKKATDDGEGYLSSLATASQGGVEGVKEGLTLEAQMMVAGAMGTKVANKLAEKGLFAGGKAGKAILHALSVGTVFGGTSAGEDLLNGKDIDTENAAKQFGMGLAFELMPVAKSLNDHLSERAEGSKINDSAAQTAALATTASNLNAESALRTLIHTPIDQVAAIHENVPSSYSTLYANSIEAGANAYDAKDIAEKRNLYANQMLLKTQGDIKLIADKLKTNKDAVISELIKMGVPDNTSVEEHVDDLYKKVEILSKENAKPEEVAAPAEASLPEVPQANAPAPQEANSAPANEVPAPAVTPEDVQAVVPPQNEPSDVPVVAVHPNEVKPGTTFKTAKGSSYVIHEDGTTTRDKAERADLGHEGQKGIQPKSTKTVYVTKDDLSKLDLVQAIHPDKENGGKFGISTSNDGDIGVVAYDKDGNGKIVDRTIVKPSTEPKIGLYPVEIWKGHSQPHFGNEITEINEPASLDNKTTADSIERPEIKTAKLDVNQDLADNGIGLRAVEMPDGKYGIFQETNGKVVGKSLGRFFDSAEDLNKAYDEGIKDKLTSEAIKKANTEPLKPEPKQLSEDEHKELDSLLSEDGITVKDLIKSEDEHSEPAEQSANTGPDAEKTEPVSETVQPSAADKSADGGEDTNGETVRGEGRVTNKEKAKVIADKIRAFKSDKNNLNAGVAVAIYDGALETVAKAIEAGGSIADAVQAGIDYIKSKSDGDETEYELRVRLNKDLTDSGLVDPKDLSGSIPKRKIPTSEKLPTGSVTSVDTEGDNKRGKENYSVFGKIRDIRVRNLEQLKEYARDLKNMDPYRAVKRYATSKAESSIILKTATDRIVKLVGKEGWDNLRQTLAESRLRGVKQRWANWGDDMLNMSDEETKEIFADGKDSKMYQIIGDLRGLEGEENPEEIAAGLISNGNYQEAREYMADLLHQAADDVLTLGPLKNGKTFDEVVDGDKFVDDKMQQAFENYKKFIEKPINESHESNEGVMSDALGPLETYYPLSPTGNDQHFVANGPKFRAPLNVNNKFTTGHSENYSTEIADLSSKLARSIRTNNKANAVNALKDAGLLVDVNKSDPDNGIITINGEEFTARKEKVADSKTITGSDGKPLHTSSRYVMMPNWLYSELKPIFDAESNYDEFSLFGRVNNTLVKFQLGGPMEATGHSFRLLGGIVNAMPFMHEWALKNGIVGKAGGLVLNNPFTKTFLGLGQILSTDISSEEAMTTIQEMAKIGIIPEKTWTKTWSKDFAELMGAKKVGFWDFSPILYGKRSLDLKARVLMYNLTKAMNPEATPEQHAKMQNELGNYTMALQGQMERFVKHHGLAPFYSFSSAIYRSGIKSVFGSTPLPLERPTVKEMMTTGAGAGKAAKLAAYKTAQLISSGIVGSVGYWALTYHAQTGKWPWDDRHSKLGRLPFPEWAKNDANKKMFFDKKSKTWSDLDMFGYTNPFIARGLRAIGAPRGYETAMLGGSAGQVAEATELQAINTNISPYTNSPMVSMGVTATTGSAPYITSLRDDKGRPAIDMFRKSRTMPAGAQIPANLVVGAQTLNPVIDKGVDMLTNGLGMKSFKSGYTPEDQGAASAFKFMLDIAFPRLFAKHGNDEMKSYYVHKEKRAIKQTMRKEAHKK